MEIEFVNTFWLVHDKIVTTKPQTSVLIVLQ